MQPYIKVNIGPAEAYMIEKVITFPKFLRNLS